MALGVVLALEARGAETDVAIDAKKPGTGFFGAQGVPGDFKIVQYPASPFIATETETVYEMLWLAKVGKDDVVYDLGSGDGRIVIAAVRDFGARRVVGIEINPELVEQSIENARAAGVADRVEFVEQDLFTTDFSEATVVALYLGHIKNIQLRPKLFRSLKPGARVVSHKFGMGEWEPDKTLITRNFHYGMRAETRTPFDDNPRVPSYTGNESRIGLTDVVMLWTIPARAAGMWRGTVEMSDGPAELTLELHQRPGEIGGRTEMGEMQRANVPVYLVGSQLRFWSGVASRRRGGGSPILNFTGEVHEDRITGKLYLTEGIETVSQQLELRRTPADLAGLWPAAPTGAGQQFQLRLEREGDGIEGTYDSAPLEDLYDFGGGIYFTVYREIDADTGEAPFGWLIGEAALVDGSLQGTTAFHGMSLSEVVVTTTEKTEWTAERVEE